jgi:hypothetical protein
MLPISVTEETSQEERSIKVEYELELENAFAMFVTKLVFQDDITPYGLETHIPSLLELKQFDIEF